MKKTRYLGLLLVLFVLISCKKNDDDVVQVPDATDEPDAQVENRAPGAFTLLEVKDEDTAVSLLPTFRWNTSTDPDGDKVRYDFLLGQGQGKIESIAHDLNTATYTLNDRLSLSSEYFWKVTAKDGKGKEESSNVFSFVTRMLNNPLSATISEANFAPRMLHTVTFFNNRLWLHCGQNETGILADVWYSDDGISWTGVDDAGVDRLRGHTSVAFRDTLWTLGGRTRIGKNTRSRYMFPTYGHGLFDPGVAPYDAPWERREMHTSAVFLDKVWVLGGVNAADVPLNDVWSTADVKGWDESGEHNPAPWSARFGHTSVVFDDRLWVIGGFDGTNYLNDVWYTTDGATWTEATPNAPFLPRVSHAAVVYDNKIWLYGGDDPSRVFGDIWYSENGQDWTRFALGGNYERRVRPTLNAFNDQMVLIGGWDWDDPEKYYNDIWVFD
ncbi:hypothetical protein FGM00_14235 [Aggregatimonas sangjinii]|uniref:Fibronectin type-III domain-containing protein n=1 Tax=Aggregatimonas sangjinii TaxID=2583587 RepID=A0A5B7SVN4_9FLAO|nr:kelch repeat-containing protein [Aggregatimonas sangjinii]QCX01213.1 hypothetical protein FGM00_14235 [Aggregatimonas sangjinii]